jgi:hypothetical protein
MSSINLLDQNSKLRKRKDDDRPSNVSTQLNANTCVAALLSTEGPVKPVVNPKKLNSSSPYSRNQQVDGGGAGGGGGINWSGDT